MNSLIDSASSFLSFFRAGKILSDSKICPSKVSDVVELEKISGIYDEVRFHLTTLIKDENSKICFYRRVFDHVKKNPQNDIEISFVRFQSGESSGTELDLPNFYGENREQSDLQEEEWEHFFLEVSEQYYSMFDTRTVSEYCREIITRKSKWISRIEGNEKDLESAYLNPTKKNRMFITRSGPLFLRIYSNQEKEKLRTGGYGNRFQKTKKAGMPSLE